MDTVIQHGEEPIEGLEPEKSIEKPAEKSDLEKRFEALEGELKARDKRIEELSSSERYWAEKARGGKREEPEAETEPEDEADDEKPEKLLDDLSTRGLKAIRERGFITESEVRKMVNDRLNETLDQVQEGQRFDAKLQRDFPDITDQKSELFKRAGAHFREMAELDPKAKNSRVALYAAAKLAQKELDMEKAASTRTDKEANRRERIASQQPERGRGSEEDGGGELEMSPTARQVIKNLERFGVTESEFKKHQGVKRGR